LPPLSSTWRVVIADPTNLLETVRDSRLHRFFAYVEEKRAGRRFAARRDIEPLDLTYILGNLVLLEVHYAPLRFRYRLFGSVHSVRRGADLTGKLLDEALEPEYRAFILARYEEVIATRRPNGGVFETFFDGKARRYQALRVPLSSDGEVIDMVLTAVTPIEDARPGGLNSGG
jgi:hypothetical protein